MTPSMLNDQSGSRPFRVTKYYRMMYAPVVIDYSIAFAVNITTIVHSVVGFSVFFW